MNRFFIKFIKNEIKPNKKLTFQFKYNNRKDKLYNIKYQNQGYKYQQQIFKNNKKKMDERNNFNSFEFNSPKLTIP